MTHYEFTLRFAVPSNTVVSDMLIEQLGDAGCDDALIGVGRTGRIALEFVRTAGSARQAIMSAIRDVQKVLPEAELLEATPDVVSLTEMAKILGCSRQNMRKMLVTCTSSAPAPVHEGASMLWHLATVLRWLADSRRYKIARELLELSQATMGVNAALETLRTDDHSRDEILALLAPS